MDKELLESMNLDEDVKAPIELLIDNGFETIASCDGVLDHHKDITYELGKGYIALKDSNESLDLLALMIDNNYDFSISSKNTKTIFDLYGQSLDGNNVTFRFSNHNQENSNKILSLIKEFILGQSIPNESTKSFVHNLNDLICLDDDKKDLNFRYISNFGLNVKTCPALAISNKKEIDSNINLEDLTQMLISNFNIEECSYKDLPTNQSPIRIAKTNSMIAICFDISESNTIYKIIKFIKENENKIKRI